MSMVCSNCLLATGELLLRRDQFVLAHALVGPHRRGPGKAGVETRADAVDVAPRPQALASVELLRRSETRRYTSARIG